MKKIFYTLMIVALFVSCLQKPKTMENLWPSGIERYWAGPQFLSVPETAWKLDSGRLVCVKPGRNRGVVMLTRAVSYPTEGFEISFEGGFVNENLRAGTKMGIVLGLPEKDEDTINFEKALFAGVSSDGKLMLAEKSVMLKKALVPGEKMIFDVEGTPTENGRLHLLLRVRNEASDIELGELSVNTDPGLVKGLVSLFCDSGAEGVKGGVVWFEALEINGAAIAGFPEKARGPVLDVDYRFNDNNLQMTVKTAPLVLNDNNRFVVLQVRGSGEWETVDKKALDKGYSVTFNVEVKETENRYYRVYTRFIDRFGSLKYHYVTGKLIQSKTE
jgi:hypothetical protein